MTYEENPDKHLGTSQRSFVGRPRSILQENQFNILYGEAAAVSLLH
jgi:hypothetical protein